MKKHLNILFPQWQGGGTLATWEGAAALKRVYLQDAEYIEIPVDLREDLEKENGIVGYAPIMKQLKALRQHLAEVRPDTLFVMGGGDDVDILPPAYCNALVQGDMTVAFFDAHGDLNTPESSPSGNLHGMPLRAMLGETDPEILKLMDSTLKPEQVIMVGTRDCDPPEEAFIHSNDITVLPPGAVNGEAGRLLQEIKRKGSQNVFIHIDIDVLDPQEFPFQPVPAEHGVTKSALCEMLDLIQENCNIVGMCILGYTKLPDETDPVLAKLVDLGLRLQR